MHFLHSGRRVFARLCVLFAAVLAGAGGSLLAVCGPFTDVSDAGFCPFILEIFSLGITTGTTPTTYDPSGNVSRIQMAAFLSRTVDRTLQRGSRRAAIDQFWTPQAPANLALTAITGGANLIKSDGEDVWVASFGGSAVVRVHASDGKILQTWTGATGAYGVLAAMGRIFVNSQSNPGNLYRIDPSQPAGAVTTVASNLGGLPSGSAFDGSRIWTANALPGSVSIVTPTVSLPWTVTTVSTGFTQPAGALYDGTAIWVADTSALLKLDFFASVLQTVTVGSQPLFPIFDGTNIWVPNRADSSVSVVRASSGAVLATLTGNGLLNPFAAAFDGQRVLVTNNNGASVSLWKAADFTTLGTFQLGANTDPRGACSDGTSFWVALSGTNQIARF